MGPNALTLLVVAALVAAVDLAHKAQALAVRGDDVLLHERSPAYAAGIVVAVSAWSLAVLAARSRGLAVGAGLLLGGAVGNAGSWLLWPARDGVPNPWLLDGGSWALAFNVADVAVACALLLVVPVALTFGARNRNRLRERVALRP